MTQDIKNIQEILAHMQQEMAQMHDEIFEQQKEISRLTIETRHLNEKIKTMQNSDGILSPEDDIPPPHY